MKLCFLTHAFPPAQTAAASYSGNFVNELLKNGVEVTVITSKRGNESPDFEEIDNLSIYRVNFKLPIFADFLEFMIKISKVLEWINEKKKFDLIHSEHLFPAPCAGTFAKSNRLPHVVTIEGVSNVSTYSKFLFEVHKLLLPRISYDVMVSWGRYALEKYFIPWGIERRKSAVIPGAVDVHKFNPNADGKLARKKMGNGERIIFTAKPMYFTNAMGMVHAIKAMKIVASEYSNCKLVVGGDGRMKKGLVALANKLQLKDRIKFIGWIPQKQMPSYYKAADVIVDSFIFSHPGSVTALESLASGTPNVMSKIECLPGEVNIPPRDVAILSKPGDEASIADGILKLLDDEKLGRRIGKNARGFIRKNFSIEVVTDKYLKLYEKVLGNYTVRSSK